MLGAGILYGIAWAVLPLRGEEGLGMGDVKMLAMIGAFLGWKAVLVTLVLSSFAGALIGVALMPPARRHEDGVAVRHVPRAGGGTCRDGRIAILGSRPGSAVVFQNCGTEEQFRSFLVSQAPVPALNSDAYVLLGLTAIVGRLGAATFAVLRLGAAARDTRRSRHQGSGEAPCCRPRCRRRWRSSRRRSAPRRHAPRRPSG